MNAVLNMISFIATLIVAEGIIYFVMDLILGKIKLLNKTIAINVQIKHVIFYSTGLILLFVFAKFHRPW